MKSSFRYAKVGTAVVGGVVLLTWPFLNSESWRGVLIAALVALPVQVISFALLQRYRHELKRFIIAWVGSTVVRIGVIGIVALVAFRSGMAGGVSMLLALATFFFGLLLLEPVYFRPERNGTG